MHRPLTPRVPLNIKHLGESLVITRFTNALVRSRPLKEKGAEQVHT